MHILTQPIRARIKKFLEGGGTTPSVAAMLLDYAAGQD